MYWHLATFLLFLVFNPSCSESARLAPDAPPSEEDVGGKLFGGENLRRPEPFMVSVRSSTGVHSCGGSLIHPLAVLTAAHCVKNGFKPDVHIGRYRRVGNDDYEFDTRKTIEIIVHEDYNPANYDYDIALLILDSPSSHRLLSLSSSDSCFQQGSDCPVRLLGWGLTSENGFFAEIIQQAFTRSVSHKNCQNLLGPSRVTDRMICAGELPDGKIDTCQGDSGGPMILKGNQVGIASFGFGCGNRLSPGVYTSVPMLHSWIQSKLSSIEPFASPISDPCECAKDGISNGVSTSRFGCKQHLLARGDTDFFCMTIGGTDCSNASPSEPFPGAAWVLCG